MKGLGPMSATPRTCHAFFIYLRRLPAVGKPAFPSCTTACNIGVTSVKSWSTYLRRARSELRKPRACIKHVVRAALLTNGGPRSCLSLLQYLSGAAVLHNAPILPADCTSLMRSQSAIIQSCLTQDSRCSLLLSRQFALSLLLEQSNLALPNYCFSVLERPECFDPRFEMPHYKQDLDGKPRVLLPSDQKQCIESPPIV